ncbi:DNA gyrase inhibitor YacG [Candidatus Erwinia haradaeae]
MLSGTKNNWRFFCRKHCQLIDLGRWLNKDIQNSPMHHINDKGR